MIIKLLKYFLLSAIIFIATTNFAHGILEINYINPNKSSQYFTLKKTLTYTPFIQQNSSLKNRFLFPYSWGVGIEVFTYSQQYSAAKLTLQNETITAYSDSLSQHIVAGEDQIFIKPNVWVLPFLNIYGIVGYTRGNVTPDITAHRIILQLPYQDTIYEITIDTSVNISKPMKYNGPVYGLGFTAFYVYRKFFVELDYNYSEVYPKDMEGKLVSHRLSPKVGMMLNSKNENSQGAVWLGASWLNNSQTLTGTVNVRKIVGDLADYIGETANYVAALKQISRWNMVAGGSWAINQHFNVGLEVGFIGRKKLSLGFLYRFY